MPTTVHIPEALLKSVDRRARALGVSRNRLIVRSSSFLPSCRELNGPMLSVMLMAA